MWCKAGVKDPDLRGHARRTFFVVSTHVIVTDVALILDRTGALSTSVRVCSSINRLETCNERWCRSREDSRMRGGEKENREERSVAIVFHKKLTKDRLTRLII